MIRKFLLLSLISGLLITVSCKSDDTLPNAEIVVISGDNQTGIAGEFLLEPIVIKVSSKYPPDMLMVLGKEVDGFGHIYVENPVTPDFARVPILDENYEAKIYFSLGCNVGEQTFEIHIRSAECMEMEECELLGSQTVSFTSTPNASDWTKLCGTPYLNKVVKYNGVAFSTTSLLFWNDRSSLMKSSDLINWEPLEEFDQPISAFDILSDGSILVLTNNGVFQNSTGSNWQNIGETLLTMGVLLYSPEMLAEDSLISVINIENEFDSYAQLYQTRDNGQTWDHVAIPLVYSASRSKNGNLYAFNYENQIYTSSNSGNSWDLLNYSGSISGTIKSTIPAGSDQLLILTTDQIGSPEPLHATLYSYLYLLDLRTLTLEEIEVEGYITDIDSYNDQSFILTSTGDIFRLTNELQKISGPQKTFPDAEGFFAFGFDHLFINTNDEFLISGLKDTYINFSN